MDHFLGSSALHGRSFFIQYQSNRKVLVVSSAMVFHLETPKAAVKKCWSLVSAEELTKTRSVLMTSALHHSNSLEFPNFELELMYWVS